MPTKKIPWFETGLSVFGLLIGLLIGLSISPVVNTVIGLLFAFIGGSIIVLIKGRSEDELSAIGRSITSICLLIIVGVALGIYLRLGSLLTSPVTSAPYVIESSLTVDDIKSLGNRPDYAELICHLIKSSKSEVQPQALSKVELKELMNAGVDESSLLAMIDPGYACNAKQNNKNGAGAEETSSNLPQGAYLYGDEQESGSHIYIPPLPFTVEKE